MENHITLPQRADHATKEIVQDLPQILFTLDELAPLLRAAYMDGWLSCERIALGQVIEDLESLK